MKTDIEISREAKKENINKIAKKLGISGRYLECYGKEKAKINLNIMKKVKNNKDGKLILVTSTNPTPYGEGKTTMSIGINDAMNKIGKKSLVVLREPSLGPVFGIKGGATGGGYSQVVPMEDINLHFTGDLHAIETCNNLLCAIIDNHIYQGNKLDLDVNRITFQRCVDLNDRALRNVTVKYDNKGLMRNDKYNITVASEIMAILCLSNDITDLKRRLGNILIGYTKKGRMVFARELHCVDALALLLKDAIKPNLVQTLENNPAIIHGGPFANIAHGCNSVIATKLGLKLSDYVITEAGFGADLGAEKFLDIKCRKSGLKPDAVVCVATIRALKYHGGQDKNDIKNENIEALKNGINNLNKHISNLKDVFGLNVIVAINKFDTDTDKEIEILEEELNKQNIKLSLVESHQKGGKGAEDLARKIVNLCDEESNFKFVYDDNDDIRTKIKKVATIIYGAKEVIYSKEAEEKILKIEKLGYSKLPVCIAKTQYSFSDDPKNLECKEPFEINVRDIWLRTGAEFIVAITGKIMTMPGLPQIPAAEKINIDDNDEIIGIF